MAQIIWDKRTLMTIWSRKGTLRPHAHRTDVGRWRGVDIRRFNVAFALVASLICLTNSVVFVVVIDELMITFLYYSFENLPSHSLMTLCKTCITWTKVSIVSGLHFMSILRSQNFAAKGAFHYFLALDNLLLKNLLLSVNSVREIFIHNIFL